jgi:hypothetical protein
MHLSITADRHSMSKSGACFAGGVLLGQRPGMIVCADAFDVILPPTTLPDIDLQDSRPVRPAATVDA